MSYYESFPDTENKIQVFSSNYWVSVPHFHRSIELIYVKSGTLTATIYMGQEKIFTQGDIVFIPSYSPHCILESSAHTIVMQIPEYFFGEIEQQSSLQFFTFQNKEINQSIYKVIHAIEQCDMRDELIISGLIRVLFGIILKEYEPLNMKPHSEMHIVAQIIEYLDEHFKEPVTVAQTAQHFGFSKNYFSKLFNEYFRCNFNTYINQIRINYIEKNKNNGSFNITDLILESGFNSISTYYAFMQRLENGKTMKTFSLSNGAPPSET